MAVRITGKIGVEISGGNLVRFSGKSKQFSWKNIE